MVRNREPLNNQPFFRYDHWTEISAIDRGARPYYDLAIERLGSLESASNPSQEAMTGLVAFLRDRLAAEGSRVRVDLSGTTFRLTHALSTLDEFLEGGQDRPLRAQALTAAVYDVAHGEQLVESRGLYDPSRHGPGDVRVSDADGSVRIAAETRGKAVSFTDAVIFIDLCAEAGVQRAHLVALVADSQLAREGLARYGAIHGVLVCVIESTTELVIVTLANVAKPLSDSLSKLPERVAIRLTNHDASAQTLLEWADLCSSRLSPGESLSPDSP